ncbi:hypothetical protein GY45DRAFT_710740 [Cubamyces sp. BRFM 1775]|nr:hypothetical protein GY45DRAFT_710740 [Cubamyces sp. BRFM 1775]
MVARSCRGARNRRRSLSRRCTFAERALRRSRGVSRLGNRAMGDAQRVMQPSASDTATRSVAATLVQCSTLGLLAHAGPVLGTRSWTPAASRELSQSSLGTNELALSVSFFDRP